MEDNQFLHNIQIYNMLHTYLHKVDGFKQSPLYSRKIKTKILIDTAR